jgi:hypothetical protein
MKILHITLTLISIWIAGTFIRLPSWSIRGDISKITIRYSTQNSSKEFRLDTQEEIKNLNDACGTIWFTPFILNSYEGKPSWTLEIIRTDGSKDTIYVDENEFGSQASPSQSILKYLIQNYS